MLAKSYFLRLTEKAKSGRFLNYAARRNPLFYNPVARLIADTPAPIKLAKSANTDRLIARTLRWARQTVYGRSYGHDLSGWPLLSKQQVQTHPDHFRRYLSVGVPASTGGSSGTPLKLWRSLQCIAAEQAFLDSLIAPSFDSLLKTRVAVLRADYVKDPRDKEPPYGQWNYGKRWLVLSSSHLSENTIGWYLETLKKFSPSVLWVYPSALGLLLGLMDKRALGLQVPIVLSSSEIMSSSLFHYAGDQLGTRVIDYYWQGERSCFASTDTTGCYWFHCLYGTVELLPVAEASKIPGVMTAKIVATGHWNSSFPLVRYDTGDLAILPTGSSPEDVLAIARGEQPFLGILGRSSDYVVGRDGKRFTGMNHIPRDTAEVLQVQIIQDGFGSIRIAVRCRNELTGSDRERLLQNAREILPEEMIVEVVQETELERAQNGKTPFIIRQNVSIPIGD